MLCEPLQRQYIFPTINWGNTKRKVKAVVTLIPVQVAFLRTFPDITVVNGWVPGELPGYVLISYVHHVKIDVTAVIGESSELP